MEASEEKVKVLQDIFALLCKKIHMYKMILFFFIQGATTADVFYWVFHLFYVIMLCKITFHDSNSCMASSSAHLEINVSPIFLVLKQIFSTFFCRLEAQALTEFFKHINKL